MNGENIREFPTEKVKKAKLSDFIQHGGIDIPFFAIVVALLTIGLVCLFSASFPYAYYYENNSYYYFSHQLAFAIVGFAVMIFMSKINYKVLKGFVKPLGIVSVLLLCVVLVYHTNVGNFKRWIPLGPLTFQPSDVAKFAIVLVFAWYISKYYSKMKEVKYGIIIPVAILAVFCGLIYLEHHLSCTILVFCIGASMMFVGGTNKKLFVFGGCAAGAAIAAVILFPNVLMEYAGTRIEAWLDKSFDPSGVRWQTNNSLYAISSGGAFGVGLGNSKQKYLYVSEPQNDFIFSIVCEELGFVGAAIIIVLFALLLWRGTLIAIRCPDKFGSLMVIGIIAQVGVQTVLNIMVVTDTIPNTGISLPFFSYGGTAMLMLLFEMGIIMSISRHSNLEKV